MTIVHTILSIVASQGLSLHQMDVKNNFLHGDMHVESPPELSILPCFDDSPPLPTRFKPEIVYTQRLQTLHV